MPVTHKWTHRSLTVICGTGMVIGFAGTIAPVSAGATSPLQVTTTADSGAGSLRQAIAAAVDGDTITFAASVTGTIALASPLSVERAVTITGPGAATLALDGGNHVQDLVIGSGAGTVTVSDLTLTHGSGSTGGAVQDVSGRGLTLMNVAVTNSDASAGGGGIYASGSQQLSVIDSTVSDNTAPNGGGIFAVLPRSSGLLVQGSTISGNTATSGQGAGIYAGGRTTATPGLTKARAAESPNSVRLPPPPTPTPTSPGSVVVATSTIADNTADGANSALYLLSLDANSRLSADTIADNSATGLTLDTPLGDHVPLAATIVAHNTADCAGAPLADGGYNIDSDGSCSFSASGSDSHSAAIDAALASLSLNGGPTATISLSDVGDPAHAVVPAVFTVPGGTQPLCSVPDQRGILPAAAPCDIGAFQREGAPSISAVVHAKTPKTHFGWYGSPVSVTFTCDSVSASITVVCPPAIHLHDGRHDTATGKVTAQDGRTATATLRGLSIDTIPPQIHGQTCHDALSGIASCTIRHQHGKVSVTAVDKAGNRTVREG